MEMMGLILETSLLKNGRGFRGGTHSNETKRETVPLVDSWGFNLKKGDLENRVLHEDVEQDNRHTTRRSEKCLVA